MFIVFVKFCWIFIICPFWNLIQVVDFMLKHDFGSIYCWLDYWIAFF